MGYDLHETIWYLREISFGIDMLEVNSLVYVYGNKRLLGRIIKIIDRESVNDGCFKVYKVLMDKLYNNTGYFLKEDLVETSIKELVIDRL